MVQTLPVFRPLSGREPLATASEEQQSGTHGEHRDATPGQQADRRARQRERRLVATAATRRRRRARRRLRGGAGRRCARFVGRRGAGLLAGRGARLRALHHDDGLLEDAPLLAVLAGLDRDDEPVLAVVHALEPEGDRLAGLDPLDDRGLVAQLDLGQNGAVLGRVADRDVLRVPLAGGHAALVVDVRPLDARLLAVALALVAGEHQRRVVGQLARVRVLTLVVTPVDDLADVGLAPVVAALVAALALAREQAVLGDHGGDGGVDGAGVAVGRGRRAGQQAEPEQCDAGGCEARQETSGSGGDPLFGCTHVQFLLASVSKQERASDFRPWHAKEIIPQY